MLHGGWSISSPEPSENFLTCSSLFTAVIVGKRASPPARRYAQPFLPKNSKQLNFFCDAPFCVFFLFCAHLLDCTSTDPSLLILFALKARFFYSRFCPSIVGRLI
jgi:hypothetical protein